MFFLNKRGDSDKDGRSNSYAQIQAHIPIRYQENAVGHAVRALYLYAAMADAAMEFSDDQRLHDILKTLFEDITNKRMYITGGVGQTHIGEMFSREYFLPNETAYNETCAAIAMVFFCRRMLELTGESKYADIIEKEIYNGALSGVSLDGKGFFYTNPVSIDTENRKKDYGDDWFPITQRVEVFECSCCPPNILRFVAMMGDNIFGADGDTYYVHQFMNSNCDKVKIITDFPNSSIVKITADVSKLHIRIPAWCEKFDCNKPYTVENGYAVITDTKGEIEINLNMVPVLMEANSLVADDGGRVALTYGPLVYCIEGVDHTEKLSQLYVDGDLKTTIRYDDLFGANVIFAEGFKKINSGLYTKYNNNNFEKTKLKFIPYFGFANRGETNMEVFVKVK